MVAQVDPNNIKANLLNQTAHGYKKCGRMCDSCDNFVLQKTFLYILLQELNLRFAEIALVIHKTLYALYTVKSLINKVLDLASNGNHY